jgi:hypothetical protein
MYVDDLPTIRCFERYLHAIGASVAEAKREAVASWPLIAKLDPEKRLPAARRLALEHLGAEEAFDPVLGYLGRPAITTAGGIAAHRIESVFRRAGMLGRISEVLRRDAMNEAARIIDGAIEASDAARARAEKRAEEPKQARAGKIGRSKTGSVTPIQPGKRRRITQ